MERIPAAVTAEELEKLPEAVRSLYAEKDDVHVLQVEPASGWALDRPEELKNALKSERGRNEAGRKALEALGEIDPRAAADAYGRVADLEEKLRAAGKGRGASDEEIADAVEKATSKLKTELDEKNSRIDELTSGSIKRDFREKLRGSLRKVLEDAGAAMDIDDAMTLLEPHVMNRTTRELNGSGLVVHVLGKDGKPDITGKPGSTEGKTLDELLQDMKAEAPFARVFAKPGAEGFRGRTSTQRAGGPARSVSDDTEPERLSPMDRLKAANEEAAAKAGLGGSR
jgi:hypothetical protein